jgi:aldehyde:ferredoxin oxidoreductase
MNGYYGTLLDIDLSKRKIETRQIFPEDLKNFIGGRGLAMKLLYDAIPKAGIDPLSADNVLLFMPGPFSGFPIPNSSRTCVVCKSPMTSPLKSDLPFASTVSYSNMGGFFGPELRFAGYDGLMVRGKADKPVYIFIEDDRVEIRDASKYWGMGTDQFDREFTADLGDQRFRSCYIGPSGEKQLRYACVVNTAARAAGRGGTGCVMGSKNLKAVAVKGTKIPDVGDHPKFVALIEKARQSFAINSADRERWRTGGTANALESSSDAGTMAVKNYSESSFTEIDKINTASARQQVWKRDFACFVCQLSCKKSGMAKGAYGGFVHDGPEYETGTMLGANLLISDLNGLNKCITVADDYGIDIISLGNVIGFLMEAYDKKLIDIGFLDGIDLKWGSVDATLQMIHKIGKREAGIGEKASYGVKKLAALIGKDSDKFAIHVKGHELAAWNIYTAPTKTGMSYATANRGACHMNGGSPERQDKSALRDSLGMCSFADSWYKDELAYHNFLSAITGFEWTANDVAQAGERIFTLEKMFNYREGFRKEDDFLPERFYIDKPTGGPAEGKNVSREEFAKALDKYYESRGWDLTTSRPANARLEALGLRFTI